jgi:hypothetical protein
MADDKINKDNVNQAKEYLKFLIETRDISRDITSFTKALLKANKENTELSSSILSTYRNIGKAINDQSDNITKVLANEKSTKDITKDILKNRRLEIDLSKEQLTFTQKLSDLKEKLQQAADANNETEFEKINSQINYTKKLSESINEQAKAIGETNEANLLAKKISEDADKKTRGFSTIEKIVKSIPGLKGLSEPFEKAAAAARSAALSQKSGAEIFKAGASGIGDFLKGPIWITSLYKVAKFFFDAMLGADKRVTDIAKNLSISKDSARAVYQSFIDSKTVLDAQLSTTKNIVEAFNELSDFSNFINLATTKQLDTQIILTKEIGVSKEAALGFQSILEVSNIEADKGVDIVYNQIAAFSRQNGIVANGRKIFEEINKTSKLTQLNFRGGFESLVKTTLQANKLGLTLDQVSKVGSSLLDFESSISAELEAELLTGKNINLEKARLFALNHDIAGLTQEIANQGITAEKFTAMNVIQQEAIAKSLGMQASELGEALYNQKLIEQTAGTFTKDLRAQAAEARKINNLALEKKLLLQAEGIEKGIISGKDLEAAQRSLSIQDKFNNALEQAQEIFSDIVNGGLLDDLVNLLTAFVKSVQTKGLGSTLLGGVDEAAQREADLMQAKRNTQNISVASVSKKSESEQNADIEALQEKKRVLQEQIDKKPGFFTEANYAINKFTGFDPLKVSAAVPERERQAVEAQKQLPEVEKLLRELTEAVKQGGNINMEARQVGTTTAINTYRM